MSQYRPFVLDDRTNKRTSVALLLVLGLVFFEDFLRMVSPIGGAGWLLIKDVILIGLYVGLIVPLAFYRYSVRLPRISIPLVVYFLLTIIVYFYSIIAHQSPFGGILIAMRVDLFYLPLAFVISYALMWNKFPQLLMRLFYFVVIVNILVAMTQYLSPGLLDGISGFSGLQEEGLNLNQKASFHDLVISYLYGLFSGVGKFTRNMFNIFIWIWLIYLVFNVGKLNRIVLLSVMIGFVLVISAKRLPVVLWLFVVILIPVVMNLSLSFSNKYTFQEKYDCWSISLIRNKMSFILLGLMVFVIFFLLSTGNAQLYLDFIYHALAYQIEERFFGDSDQYFWQAEVNRFTSDLAIFGQGAGTSTMGIHYLIPIQELASAGYFNVEHGPLKVILELGMLGGIQMIFLWSALFFIDFSVIRKTRHQPRWMAASMLITLYHVTTLASFFVGHQYWDDVQGQIHHWMITGVQLFLWRNNAVTRMPACDKNQQHVALNAVTVKQTYG